MTTVGTASRDYLSTILVKLPDEARVALERGRGGQLLRLEGTPKAAGTAKSGDAALCVCGRWGGRGEGMRDVEGVGRTISAQFGGRNRNSIACPSTYIHICTHIPQH